MSPQPPRPEHAVADFFAPLFSVKTLLTSSFLGPVAVFPAITTVGTIKRTTADSQLYCFASGSAINPNPFNNFLNVFLNIDGGIAFGLIRFATFQNHHLTLVPKFESLDVAVPRDLNPHTVGMSYDAATTVTNADDVFSLVILEFPPPL